MHEPTSMRPPDLENACRLVAWAAAIVARRADVATAAAAIEAGGSGHVVAGVPGTPGDVPLIDALAWLRDVQPRRATMVAPAAGDPLGLQGPSRFADAAIAAGSGVAFECAQGEPFGWAPRIDARGSSYLGVRWESQPGAAAAPALSIAPDRVLEQSDRALRRALRAATQTLSDIDLARWRAEAVNGRQAADAMMRGHARALPPGWPAPARALADRALPLARVLRLATSDPGALSASASTARAESLRGLSRAVREALTTAYNVPAAALLAAAHERDQR